MQSDHNSLEDNKGLRLFLLGFLTLFLELALIRYLAGSIWNLGYFPNLVLIAAFVGLGLGFIFHRNISPVVSDKIYIFVPLTVALLFLFVFLFKPQVPGFNANVAFDEFFYSSPDADSSARSTLFLFIIWFCATAAIFALISQYTAKLFACFKPLTAYTLDIGGSCAGILSFMLISWMEIDAFYWFIALLVLFWLTLEQHLQKLRTVYFSMAVLLVAAFAFIFPQKHSYWSPYQMISYKDYDDNYMTKKAIQDMTGNSQYPATLYINNLFTPHQILFDEEQIKQLMYQSVYDYRNEETALPGYKRILIIGAGTGNDVAAALMNNVESVDAIEIDPTISMIGKEFHPSRPYQDPRVTVHNTDGRAFLNNTKKKYDLIIFSLTDSLVKVSPVSQLRLENYLYTIESIQQAYQLLNNDGSLIFYHYYNQNWLLAKVSTLFAYGSGVIPHRYRNIIVYNRSELNEVEKKKQAKELSEFIYEMVTTFEFDLPHNDWPFLYLKKHEIPPFYLYAMGFLAMLIAALMTFVHRQNLKSEIRQNRYIQLAFILMGVAFLLLQTKGVIQFSLLFGTTWINNSLVFLSVLMLVLLANWTAQVIKSDKYIPIIFLLLFISCGISIIFPLSNLLYVESLFNRYFIASLLIFSPIYFANLIFSFLFRKLPTAECYFGWNLIGATLGGLLEYFSMAWGYTALAYIVLACYMFVLIFYNLRISQLLKR